MTKENLIKNHLLSGRSITPREALDLYGSFRLGAVIFNLKRKLAPQGISIINIGGEFQGTHFGKYIIERRKASGELYFGPERRKIK